MLRKRSRYFEIRFVLREPVTTTTTNNNNNNNNNNLFWHSALIR